MPDFPNSRREIAGVPIQQLSEQFGTPTFAYIGETIVQRIRDLAAFDTVRYAQKACSNLAILDLVRQHDVLVDAVSAGEIRRAMLAGYAVVGDPPPIVYTADIFDRETLDLLTTVVTDLGDAHHIQTDSQGNLYIAATGDGHLRLLFTGLSSTGSEQ